MASNANPKLVGGFVIGAVGLLVLTVALFGSGNMLEKRPRAGTYFEGSVSGLDVGAPVTYQGVRVGEVKAIHLEVDSANLTTRMPVEFEFTPGKVTWTDGPLKPAEYGRLLEKGLRAKLVSQSLVTGQLAIELGNYPGTPARTFGGLPSGVLEIPSLPSDLETLKRALTDLPLDEIAGSMVLVLSQLNKLLAEPGWRDSAVALAGGLEQFQVLMSTLNQRSGPLLGDVANVTKETGTAVSMLRLDLHDALTELRSTLGKVDAEVRPVGLRAQAAAAAAEKAFQQADTTLRTVNAALDPRSPLRGNLDQTLVNLSLATKSLRSFADQLERSPNILITGR